MKNARLIILCVSCVVLVAALVIGLTSKPTTSHNVQQPSPTIPTDAPPATIPSMPPTTQSAKSIPTGTYYMVATNVEDYFFTADTLLYSVQYYYPRLTLHPYNTCTFNCNGELHDSWQTDGNTIHFERGPSFITTLYTQINKKDDADTSTFEFSCQYIPEYDIIRITNNANSLELKRFDSPEQAAEWISQYVTTNGISVPDSFSEYANIQELN